MVHSGQVMPSEFSGGVKWQIEDGPNRRKNDCATALRGEEGLDGTAFKLEPLCNAQLLPALLKKERSVKGFSQGLHRSCCHVQPRALEPLLREGKM